MTAKGHSGPQVCEGSPQAQLRGRRYLCNVPMRPGGTSTLVPTVPAASPSPREAAHHELRSETRGGGCAASREGGLLQGLLRTQEQGCRAQGEHLSRSPS